jgi:hypothetical protein
MSQQNFGVGETAEVVVESVGRSDAGRSLL